MTTKTLLPALALSALLLAGCGSDDEPTASATDQSASGSVPGFSGDASSPATDAPSSAPEEASEEASEEATGDDDATVPDGLLPADDPDQSRNAETVTFDNGTSVTADVDDIEIIDAEGLTSLGTLPEQAETGVWQYPVEFAQAGPGYLVEQSGGEFSDLSVVFQRGEEVVIATEPEDVPFGYEGNEAEGTLVQTWTTGGGQGLYTRVRVGEGESLSDDTYRVYSWEAIVEADADGGGITLVPTDLGIACFDDEAGQARSYEAC